MSQFVLTNAVQQYTTNVQLLAQQRESRLASTVTLGAYTGKAGVPVEQFAPSEARDVVSRYSPITPNDVQSDRRWVYPTDSDWHELTDSFDKLRLLIDPTSAYVQDAVAAMNRRKDRHIISAFFSNANTGENGSTSTSFLAANQINVATGASGATGMNVAKLKAGIQRLLTLEAWEPDMGEEIYCVIGARQNFDLMNDPEFINGDYTSSRGVIEKGFVQSWGSVRFIHSELLPVNGSNQRRIPFYTKRGMHLGTWNDIEASVTRREDLSSRPWQVYVMGTFGATRIEEARVVEFPCAES